MGSLVAADVAKVAFASNALVLTYKFKDEATTIGTISTTTGLGVSAGAVGTMKYTIAKTAGTDAASAAWTNQAAGVAPYLVVTAAAAADLVQTVTVGTN